MRCLRPRADGQISRPQFFDIWEFVEISQTEVVEKKLGGFVKKRTAWDLGAAGDFHQPAFHQRLQNPLDGYAADSFDVGAHNGLAVSDNGQGFEPRSS